MASYEKLSEFHPEAESISAYPEWVELFFTANSVANDKKVAVFSSMVGGRTYSLLWDLLTPEKPQDKSLPVLFQKLKEHPESAVKLNVCSVCRSRMRLLWVCVYSTACHMHMQK